MNTDVGCISTFASSLKSKSNLFTAIWQTVGSPHNGDTSINLVKLIIWGKELKSVDDLNLLPATWASLASPILIKSCGVNENSPMSDKSTSITIVCSPNGTPIIM